MDIVVTVIGARVYGNRTVETKAEAVAQRLHDAVCDPCMTFLHGMEVVKILVIGIDQLQCDCGDRQRRSRIALQRRVHDVTVTVIVLLSGRCALDYGVEDANADICDLAGLHGRDAGEGQIFEGVDHAQSDHGAVGVQIKDRLYQLLVVVGKSRFALQFCLNEGDDSLRKVSDGLCHTKTGEQDLLGTAAVVHHFGGGIGHGLDLFRIGTACLCDLFEQEVECQSQRNAQIAHAEADDDELGVFDILLAFRAEICQLRRSHLGVAGLAEDELIAHNISHHGSIIFGIQHADLFDGTESGAAVVVIPAVLIAKVDAQSLSHDSGIAVGDHDMHAQRTFHVLQLSVSGGSQLAVSPACIAGLDQSVAGGDTVAHGSDAMHVRLLSGSEGHGEHQCSRQCNAQYQTQKLFHVSHCFLLLVYSCLLVLEQDSLSN